MIGLINISHIVTVDFILMLLREDCERTDVITENGHYQLNLEPGDDVALVRVEVEGAGMLSIG